MEEEEDEEVPDDIVLLAELVVFALNSTSKESIV